MNEVIDKAKDMPKLILHNWNFDKDVVKELRKLGYYNDTLFPEEFPEDEDLKDCTALATVGFYWVFWEYSCDPNESDPGIMNLYENEFVQDGSEESKYWKDYYDCGTNKDLFLALASLVYPNSAKNKWFVAGDYWEKTDDELPSHFMQLEGHRATFDEIVKKFS